MKRFIFALVPFMLLLSPACDRNSCNNVVCNDSPNSVCLDGQCACQQGYEGDFCDILSYEKYIGNYQVSENCQNTLSGSTNQTYTMFISQSGGTQIDKILMQSFAGNLTVEAFINGNFITIPDQSIFGNTRVSGTGQFIPAANRMTIDYAITQGSSYSECTGAFQKL